MKTKRIPMLHLLYAASAFIAVQSAEAQDLIVNGGFEDTAGTFVANGDGTMLLPNGSTTIPGWTITNNAVAWASSPTNFNLDLTGYHDSTVLGGVTQVIATIPLNTYTLSLTIVSGDSLQTGGQKIVKATFGTSSTWFDFVPTGTGVEMRRFSFNFVASASSTTIAIVGASSGTGFRYLGLDDVSVQIAPANAIVHYNIPLNPKQTYLRFNAALDFDPNAPQNPPLGPAKFDLIANGIAPGDYLFLERYGRFRWSSAFATEEGRNVWAVFSQNGTVLDNPPLDRPNDVPPLIYPPSRIPGAVAPDFQQVAAIETGRTLTASPGGVGSPTDFTEDFMADRVLVKVPVGATHLMFGAGDIKWADNLDDRPPDDFRISVTRIRDSHSDTDGDGSSDLDEILSGTDYSNPSSRPSLTISSSPLPGNARTEWTSQPFRIYEIEESPDLSLWGQIESPPLFTVPTPMQRDYPFAPPNRFFRLKVKGMFWD